MANDETVPMWRNFAAWSAVAAIFYLVVLWGATLIVNGQGMVGLVTAMLRSSRLGLTLGLGLVLSILVVGFTSRKRALNRLRLRNYLILSLAAILVFFLGGLGFNALSGAGTLRAMGVSEWVAAGTGLTITFLSLFGILMTASTHTRAELVEDEESAEDLRERSRLYMTSFGCMTACGALLAGLSLAGPAGVIPPTVAAAGAAALVAVFVVLGIASRRLSDELGHALSREAGSIAFHLTLAIGGGWAILARIGYVPAPASLDWLTLFTVLMFAASFVAVGRRRMLTR